MWTSKEAFYGSLDTTVSPPRLYFPDGSFWVMGVQSSGTEEDAGTMFPSVMEDSNGNDVENRLLKPTVLGPARQWTYDHGGKRVFQLTPKGPGVPNSACEIYFYGINGKWLASYTCNYEDQEGGDGSFYYAIKSRNVYFGGKLMRSDGKTVVTDRLGSVRANSAGERFNYYPYGEERTSTTEGREKFGTYFRDPGGVDYADQRYIESRTGRFMTADPLGMASADLRVPLTWNRYSYVEGDPLNFHDAVGLNASSVSNPGNPNIPGGSNSAADTLLHELLHVASMMYGPGAVPAGWSDNDAGDDPVSRANQDRNQQIVSSNCFQ